MLLNSCMQVLSNIPELKEILTNKSHIINSNKQNIDKKLIKEWIDLHNLMWSKNCIISPGRFVKQYRQLQKRRIEIYLQDMRKMIYQNLCYFLWIAYIIQ